jgi:hypothetical protein
MTKMGAALGQKHDRRMGMQQQASVGAPTKTDTTGAWGCNSRTSVGAPMKTDTTGACFENAELRYAQSTGFSACATLGQE